MLLVAVSSGICELQEYRLTIDQEYLDMLHAHPWGPNEYPGILSCSLWSASCMVRFRGNCTMVYPKKSWAISFPEGCASGRERLNLNAEYLDPGMMRNALSMRLSAMMDLPVSRTEHVRFFVNDDYMGLYLDVERVDGDMFRRYGYDSVALFKAVNDCARLMPCFSGTNPSQGYVARGYSEHLHYLLYELIAIVNEGGTPLPVDSETFMGYYACCLAMMDLDSGQNNHYLMLDEEGVWRVFPWDRGLSFGATGDGSFHPEYAYKKSLYRFRTNALYSRLIQDDQYRLLMEEYLAEAECLLRDSAPILVDSIFSEIREDMYNDPLSPWTQAEIDQERENIIWFCSERATFLSENTVMPGMGWANIISTGSPWLEPGETFEMSLTLEGSYDKVLMKWYMGDEAHYKWFHPEGGNSGVNWSAIFTMPAGVDHCPFDICYSSYANPKEYFYYPSYSVFKYLVFNQAAPCFVNTQPGSSAPSNTGCDFIAAPGLVQGSRLWAVPLVNISSASIDVSCCGFRMGDSPFRIYVAPGTVVLPGDTLFLTNSLEKFQQLFPGRAVAGDFGFSFTPVESLSMFDPFWDRMWTKSLSWSEEEYSPGSGLRVTEICYSQPGGELCGDWIELCNLSGEPVYPDNWLLKDVDGNVSIVQCPDTIQPGEFLLLAEHKWRFTSEFLPLCSVVDLSFRINSTADEISLMDICGNAVQTISLSEGNGDVYGLVHPNCDTWERYPFPGTPGYANRLWGGGGEHLSLSVTSGNPSRVSSIKVSITSMSFPVEVSVFDLSGRAVIQPVVLSEIISPLDLDLPETLPAGVYFITARSPSEFSSVKVTRL